VYPLSKLGTILSIIFMLALTAAMFCGGEALSQVGITVTPTRLELTVPPGDDTREQITITNASPRPIQIEGEVDSKPGVDHSAEIELTGVPLRLPPGESGEMEVKIAVPAEADAGEQQASIIFNAADVDEGDLSIIGQVRVGVLVKVIHPASNVEFSFPRIVSPGEDVVFSLSGTNSGSFPARLEGRVQLEGLSGEDKVLQASSDMLQTGESSDLQVEWTDAPYIGLRRATVSLGTGAGAPVTESGYILVFPWKLFMIVLAVALPTLSLALARRRKN
jgi:hypothetical protein